MVANQKNVVNDVVKQIGLTCKTLANRENLPEDNQNFAPHHVISIIGGRGTGKTSVVTTIAEQVKKDVAEAFVIDLISPDQLSVKFPVSAIIVYAIERSLEKRKQEQEQELEKQELEKQELEKRKQELKNQWEKIKNIPNFRHPSWAVQVENLKTYDVISRDTINTTEWHDELFKLMVSPVDLVPKFHDWLGSMLKAIGCKACVISIDDADISVEKAEEIIETIRIYLASPLIVTILAVDLPSLERKLRNIRLAKLPPVPEYKEKQDEDGFFLFGMSRAAHQSAEAQAEQEYVENLLVKVLPPATRHVLTNLSERDRLHKPFKIPKRTSKKSLYQIIEEADKKFSKDSGVNLAPLFQKYPEIFTDNVRRYSNQFLQISNVCQEYITKLTNLSDEEKTDKTDDHINLNLPTVNGDSKIVETKISQEYYLNPPETHEQGIRSEFQMQIMRPFLYEGDFPSLQSHIKQKSKIDIQQFQRIHEFAKFILRWGRLNMDRNSGEWVYQIADKSIKNSMSTALMDIMGDWMLANGVSMENIIDSFSIKIEVAAFPSIQISRKLVPYFSNNELSSRELNVSTTQALDNSVGANISVPVNKDRLMPGYIQDFSSLRRYINIVLNSSNLGSQMDSAEKYLNVLKQAKKDELKKDDLQLAVYQILGLLATQTSYHFLHLILELLLDGDVEKFFTSPQYRDRYNITTIKSLSWLILEVPDILGALIEIIELNENYSRKLLALSYVADLPMTILLGCVDGETADKKRNQLLNSIWKLFDKLTHIGLIIDRENGDRSSLGKLNPDPSGKDAVEIRNALRKHYPSFDWKRRWKAMYFFIDTTLKDAKFQISWNSAEQPPDLWKKWADDILKDYSEDNKETDADK
ncbi:MULTISPECIES: P-loop NTPase fold protein [Nostoc]|nr:MULTISPECIES: P-loop NTPase fold protein [Nostoc]MBD2648072.1 hypothetical protein [Nostoc foliaceum FACHB-393]